MTAWRMFDIHIVNVPAPVMSDEWHELRELHVAAEQDFSFRENL